MNECIFCRIVEGSSPSRRVYEDEHCIAFLDAHQISPGHCLVIPRRHIVWYTDLTAEEASHFSRAMHEVAGKIKRALDAEYINVLIRGTRVPHLHALLVPKLRGQDNILDKALDLHHYMQERLPDLGEARLDELAASISGADPSGNLSG
jgi:histidine triad (HIT) family protein